MDREVYSAAQEFVNGLMEVDPKFYKEVKIRDVLPYFHKIARKIERMRV